jgi:hypothetical protein
VSRKPDFDPASLRIVEGDLIQDHAASMREPLVKPAKKRRSEFTLVVHDWYIPAVNALARAGLHATAAIVPLYLLNRLAVDNRGDTTRPIRVANVKLGQMAVTRDVKKRALAALLQAELIEILPARGPRQTPVVLLKKYQP